MIKAKCLLLKKTSGWSEWTQPLAGMPRHGEFIRKEGTSRTFQILRIVYTTRDGKPIVELHLHDG